MRNRNDLEKRFRNSGTAAGLMPKLYVPRPCDTAARKTAETSPTERTKKLESPASRALGEALPKHSNSIQIRTQAMRNSR